MATGTTIQSADRLATDPLNAVAVLVDLRADWSDEWETDSSVLFIRARESSGGHDLSVCEIERRYGDVKQPWEQAFDETKATERVDWVGRWIRCRAFMAGGAAMGSEAVLFVGRIAAEVSEIHGDDCTLGASPGGTAVASGRQRFVAYGPLMELRKLTVDQSDWLEDYGEGDSVQRIGWLPNLNARDERGMVLGNRSAEQYAESSGDPRQSYVFGGDAVWSRYQFLDYLVRRFINRYDDAGLPTGPRWRLAGQADYLKLISDPIELPKAPTAADLLGLLIHPSIGLDYCVRYYPATDEEADGFEVAVFALLDEEIRVPAGGGDAVLPANDRPVAISGDRDLGEEGIVIVRSAERRYDEIEVLGGRIVICCTLCGAWFAAKEGRAAFPELLLTAESAASLVPKWTDQQETDYKAGAGTEAYLSCEEHDRARASQRFRGVYQVYGAPADWDFNLGRARPSLDEVGEVDESYDDSSGRTLAEAQRVIRKTLQWIPLREGFDYAVDPPVDGNDAGVLGELRAPLAAAVQLPEWAKAGEETKGRMVNLAESGIHVGVRWQDWGVFLQASPNHLLALNHFGDAQPTFNPPIWDYEKLLATVAFQADQRLRLRYVLDTGEPDGSRLVIEVPDAELWYVAAGTVVDINPQTGKPIMAYSGGDSEKPRGLTVRNDAGRLALILAGAIARYFRERCRAELHWRGIWPSTGDLGAMLRDVETEQGQELIGGPITSVEYIGGPSPRTIMRAGYAY